MMNFDTIAINVGLSFFTLFLFGHLVLIYGVYEKYQTLQKEHDNFFNEGASKDGDDLIIENNVPFQEKKVATIPYEEKYLSQVRNMKNEYVFTDEELEIERKMFETLKEEEQKNIMQSIFGYNEKIEQLKMKLFDLETTDDKSNTKKDLNIIKKIQDSLKSEMQLNETKITELQENMNKNDETLREKAKQHIIDEQLKRFKKNYVIEHTPLGNVLMFYNHDKFAFEYYSDLTIPYRYLETIARKYVLTYNYRPLYIDMQEELKEYERKLEEKEKEKTRLHHASTTEKEKKNNVFTKFKSYNTEAGNGRVNTAPPPKNNIPQNRLNISKLKNKNEGENNEKLLLKEKSNRYSHQGKFLNFNILQKIDKKVVDKKYALSFADFKKMNMNKR